MPLWNKNMSGHSRSQTKEAYFTYITAQSKSIIRHHIVRHTRRSQSTSSIDTLLIKAGATQAGRLSTSLSQT
jgi:hypothetical protein